MSNFINRTFSNLLKLSISNSNRDQTKLVMTLLVRDEVDIVRANIDFHLAHGVDHIVATDNGSIDGTLDILNEYQKAGVLTLIHEESQDFSQHLWVNRMGRIACEEQHADIVFHCDADEFWWPESGSIKNELLFRKQTDVLNVPTYNMLLQSDSLKDVFPDKMNYAVVHPLQSKNVPEDSKSSSLFLYHFPVKVIYSTEKGYLNVSQGNHGIMPDHVGYTQSRSKDISLMHYPIRSYEQFKSKVINGGASLEKNKEKNVGGWQWRRWYQSYKDGDLTEEFRVLTLQQEHIEEYLSNGTIEDWTSKHRVISSFT